MAYADPKAIGRIGQVLSRFEIDASELQAVLGSDLRLTSEEAQNRLAEMLIIVDAVRAWTKTDREALDWYRAEPVPAFGNVTPADLVRQGMASTVRSYVEHLAVGGYA